MNHQPNTPASRNEEAVALPSSEGAVTDEKKPVEAWTWFDAEGKHHLSTDEPSESESALQLTALVAAGKSSIEQIKELLPKNFELDAVRSETSYNSTEYKTEWLVRELDASGWGISIRGRGDTPQAAVRNALAAPGAAIDAREQEAIADGPGEFDPAERIRTWKQGLPAAQATCIESTRDAVFKAMQDAWNDWCVDTGCFPDDFTLTGKTITFEAGRWAASVAASLARAGDELPLFEAWIAREAGPNPDRLRVAHCRMGWLGAIKTLGLATSASKAQRFPNVSCSQCGRDFGPGNHGFSHCDQHYTVEQLAALASREEAPTPSEALSPATVAQPAARVRCWQKNGERHAELIDWDEGLFVLPPGEHALYAAQPCASQGCGGAVEEVLTEDDVFTLLGHAAVLHGNGQEDMPRYMFSLAERIAVTRGDQEAAKRVREVALSTDKSGGA